MQNNIEEEFQKVLNCGSSSSFMWKGTVFESPYGNYVAEIRVTALNGRALSPELLPEDAKYHFQLYKSGNTVGFKTVLRLDSPELRKPAHMHMYQTELPVGGPLGLLGSMFFSNFPRRIGVIDPDASL